MAEFTKEQEEALVCSAQESEAGFAALYEQYFDMIFNYILKRTGDLELAQDLTSETFMKVIQYLPNYKITEVRFSSWLYKIATNAINQHFRKKSFISVGEFLPSQEPISCETADEAIKEFQQEQEVKGEFTEVLTYIHKLKKEDQSIITLRFFENRKFAEIAEILDMKEGTVKVRMNRALTKLQRWLNKKV